MFYKERFECIGKSKTEFVFNYKQSINTPITDVIIIIIKAV